MYIYIHIYMYVYKSKIPLNSARAHINCRKLHNGNRLSSCWN